MKGDKMHFGYMKDFGVDVVIRCTTKPILNWTSDIEDVTCKNCLRLLENDLEKAKDNAYPDRIRNKKTGTTLKIRRRKGDDFVSRWEKVIKEVE